MTHLPFYQADEQSFHNPETGSTMRTMIHPDFTPDDLNGNTLELCDLFMIRAEEEVPVDSYAIVSDAVEMVVAVGPGKYKSALFLLYLMTKSAAPTFELVPEMRTLVTSYFGQKLVNEAKNPNTRHCTVRALLGTTVYIRLTLKPGYREHLATSRSPEEIIRSAWERRNDIERLSPEPFLRGALAYFFDQLERGTLRTNNTEGHWPTEEWADRALALENLLTR